MHGREQVAVREREFWMVYLAIIGIIFTAEYFIKELVEKFVPLNEKKPFLGGRLFLTKYHNEGAALNFGEKKKHLIAVISAALTLFYLVYFLLTLTKGGKEELKLAMAVLLGGAFSNTYDRLKRKYVVDYFGFTSKKKRKSEVIYNLSDFCIILGAVFSAVCG